MIRRTLTLTALALAAGAAPASAFDVYAATSLREALPALDKRPSYNFAGSNTLQLQIERGAPADLFLSASPQEAQSLYKGGRCTRPVTFATNRIVLIVPKGNPAGIKSVYRLRGGGYRLSVGNAAVPIGDYTRKLLRRMGLLSVLSKNTVSQESNVGNVVSKVALGSADAGFVYITDAKAAADRTDVLPLPRWAQPPVRYRGCVVRRDGADTAAALSYLRRLLSGEGRSVLKRFGFGLPPR
ncbi:MAG: molybdate ABC transporter substrate-binding protein [Baekduia sp.]